jgi:hypothetical protein
VSGGLHAAGVLAAMVLVCTSVGGCGADPEGQPGHQKQQERIDGEEVADLSTCHDEAETAGPPYGDGFPSGWPFPPDTVVYNAEDRGADGTIVSGVSISSFADILDFQNDDVVDAGFSIDDGETEAHDAEAEWEGNGFHGRWAIRESASCPGETVIQVLSVAD